MKSQLITKLSLSALVMLQFVFLQAQVPVSKAREVMRLYVSEEGGRNGGSVVFHPEKKLYYAAIAGNKDFPVCIFSESGVLKFCGKAQSDIRGLWYNPSSNNIEGNGYDDAGWFSYDLSKRGEITGSSIIAYGRNQPQDQSVGTFNPAKKELLFFNKDDLKVVKYSLPKKKKSGEIKLSGKSLPEFEDYTMVFTGIKNKEIGLFDPLGAMVYNFNLKGKLTETTQLPNDCPDPNLFNFAYANGIYWLFNTEKREWIGYK